MWLWVKKKSDPHWKLLKEMITQIFGVPKDHRKSKPFHDHVFVFSIVDAHIWFWNYQIAVPLNEPIKVDLGGLNKMTLVEVGPRFCLNPIKIFAGSFGGLTLYENPFYISPNQQHERRDGPSMKDWRGGRGAGQNIIPSSTGAAKEKLHKRVQERVDGGSEGSVASSETVLEIFGKSRLGILHHKISKGQSSKQANQG